jgi:hypothetical protein
VTEPTDDRRLLTQAQGPGLEGRVVWQSGAAADRRLWVRKPFSKTTSADDDFRVGNRMFFRLSEPRPATLLLALIGACRI